MNAKWTVSVQMPPVFLAFNQWEWVAMEAALAQFEAQAHGEQLEEV